MIRVLFICMGNICRSPTAEGAFTRLIRAEGLEERIWVDSAGTHAYHMGDAPDPRAIRAADRRGIALEHLRARKVAAADFDTFDYLLAMDEDNVAHLTDICPEERFLPRVRLFMDFAEDAPESNVPDPYYGGLQGFERVLDLVDDAARGLLAHIRAQHSADR
jgi:protein-tyrosine phosphatase